jgi:hypothetical protein
MALLLVFVFFAKDLDAAAAGPISITVSNFSGAAVANASIANARDDGARISTSVQNAGVTDAYPFGSSAVSTKSRISAETRLFFRHPVPKSNSDQTDKESDNRCLSQHSGRRSTDLFKGRPVIGTSNTSSQAASLVCANLAEIPRDSN